MEQDQSRLKSIEQQIKGLNRHTGELVMKLGEFLIEAKELCLHGQWENWLSHHFPYSIRTAQRFMAIATELKELPYLNNYQPTALSLLASSGVSEEVKEQITELAATGQTITPKQVKAVIMCQSESSLENDKSDITSFNELDLNNHSINDIMSVNQGQVTINDIMLSPLDPSASRSLSLSKCRVNASTTNDIVSFSKQPRDPESYLREDVSLDEIRHLTAMARTELSAPMKLAIEKGFIKPEHTILDYGCGRAGDVIRLRLKGLDITGFDPFFFPKNPLIKSDIVTLNYVLNVIESSVERVKVLRDAHQLATEYLIVAIRTDTPPSSVLPYGDGHVTSHGCFQKHYSQQEAREFVKQTLNSEPLTLASGVFVVAAK